MVAFLVGGVFMIIQTLAYNGYMAVNYDKIKHEVDFALDVNKDGEVNLEDVEQIYDKVSDIYAITIFRNISYALLFITLDSVSIELQHAHRWRLRSWPDCWIKAIEYKEWHPYENDQN